MAKTTTPIQPVVRWTYQRRIWLANAVSAKYPYFGSDNYQKLIRSFDEEARKKLPVLFKIIETHNKRVLANHDALCESNRKQSNKLTQVARLGTESECDKIAKLVL